MITYRTVFCSSENHRTDRNEERRREKEPGCQTRLVCSSSRHAPLTSPSNNRLPDHDLHIISLGDSFQGHSFSSVFGGFEAVFETKRRESDQAKRERYGAWKDETVNVHSLLEELLGIPDGDERGWRGGDDDDRGGVSWRREGEGGRKRQRFQLRACRDSKLRRKGQREETTDEVS